MDAPTSDFLASEKPEWKKMYQAALFEIDRKKLPEMIRDAEHAVIRRKEQLAHARSEPEYLALCNAHLVLRHLHRLYDANRNQAS
jgi:hypothetical protein